MMPEVHWQHCEISLISLSYIYERLLYSTGKTSTWCKSAEKPPPFLPFGEILGSNCVMWCNFTQPYFMHHWISHWGTGRKAPPPSLPPLPSSCKFNQLWFGWQKSPPPSLPPSPLSSSFNFGSAGRKAPPPLPPLPSSCKFNQLWFSWQKSPPPPSLPSSCKFNQLWFGWQKSPPHPTRIREKFLTSDLSILGNFVRNWACIIQVEYPRSPYYKSILRFFLSECLL